MLNPSIFRVFRAATLAVALISVAHANEGMRLQTASVNAHDLVSLQNGAKLFVNYCLNCHAASYMRYNRLSDLGLNEQQIRDNLIFTGVKVGELMKVAMDGKDAKEWFGVPPPDLTVITRSRSSGAGSGTDWVYTYLKSFYRDDQRPTGWNNLLFENVGMPHVLWQLSGQQQLAVQEFKSEHDAHAALIAAKSAARLDAEVSMNGGKEERRYKLRTLQPGAGTLAPIEYDKQVTDLVNYMGYMAEPMRLERRQVGTYVLLLLGVLFVFAYALKKAFWKDVH